MDTTRTRKINYFFLLGVLIINVASLVLLSSFNYYFFYREEEKAYEEKFRTSAIKEVELYIENIDVQLKTMLSIPSLYFSETGENYSLLYPQEHTIIGKPDLVRNIGTVLSKIRNTYPFLRSMDIYYEGTGTIITNFAYVHEADSVERLHGYLPWFEQVSSSKSKSFFLPYQDNSYPESSPTISYVKEITNKRWGDKGIYVALHFNSDLVRLPDKGLYLSAWLFDPEGELIFGTYDYDWQKQIIEAMGHDRSSDMLVRQITNDNGKFVAWRTISYNTNITYCSIIGYKSLYPGYSEDATNLIKNFILLIFCNTFCLGLITILNYFLYKKYIVSFSQRAGIQTKGSLGQTLKTMETTIESLDDESKRYRNQTLLRSLLMNSADKNDYDSAYDTARGEYVCCVIIEQPSDVGRLSLDKIQECVEELSKDKTVLFTTFADPLRIAIAFILQEPVLSDDSLQRIRQLGPELPIDIGGFFPLRSNGFQNSYSSAMDVYEYRFLDDKNVVLKHEILQLEDRKSFGDHVGLCSQIDKFIKLEQREPAFQLMAKLFDDLEHGGYSIQYIKATLADLVTALYNMLTQQKIDMWAIFGYDIRAYSTMVNSIVAYKEWMHTVVQTVVDAIADSRNRTDNVLYQKINSIIDENLSNDISLGMVADVLRVREDTLSRSFKSVMGCNYMEFITERKLQKAVDLLYQDIPVQEISAVLGYRSPQYFIKVFKNAYGVTPHKFKKSRESMEGKP